MTAKTLMIQGTGSDVGKSIIVAGLCRVMSRRGISVAPFKPQNMSNNAAACSRGREIGRAQALQAKAAGIEPDVHLNPVLLKPQSDCEAQVVLHGKVVSTLEAKNFLTHRVSLMEPVMDSYRKLASEYELVLVEGAGSPAETNLRKNDIANMGFAREANVPVCLLADIERGGVIASVVGTKIVLDPEDSALIRSFMVNKFRGELALFDDGVRDIEHFTGWGCRGVIPWINAARSLPQEDTIITGPLFLTSGERASPTVKIVVPIFSRLANSDDFDPLRLEKKVDFEFIQPGRAIPRDVDIIVLGGTKSTLADLEFIREQGWDHDIIAHARAGGKVLGLCGGYQLLGRKIRDPHGIEGPPGEADALGLLNIETEMYEEKVVRTYRGMHKIYNTAISGYEIHIGETTGPDTTRRWIRSEHGEDGAINPEGNVAGCYAHGLFWSDAFRISWLEDLRKNSSSELAYDAKVEASLEQLANTLEESLDIDALMKDAA